MYYLLMRFVDIIVIYVHSIVTYEQVFVFLPAYANSIIIIFGSFQGTQGR